MNHEINTAILAHNGVEIYQNDIDIVCQEYIQSLPFPDMVTKSSVFSGMLAEISRKIIKPFIDNDRKKRNTTRYDYDLLNDIFYLIFIPLCNRFNICGSVLLFSVFCGIPNEHLSDIRNGVYRFNGSTVNPANAQTVKNWYHTIESNLLLKATNESSIGSIFALKANYNYNDNLQKIEIVNSANSADTPAQIMEKYKDIEPPIIDMNGE